MMSRMIQDYKKERILNTLHNSQEYKRTIRNTKKYQWGTKSIEQHERMARNIKEYSGIVGNTIAH